MCISTPLPADFAQAQPACFLPAVLTSPCRGQVQSRLACLASPAQDSSRDFEVLQKTSTSTSLRPRSNCPIATASPRPPSSVRSFLRSRSLSLTTPLLFVPPCPSSPPFAATCRRHATTVDRARRSHGSNPLGACCRKGASIMNVSCRVESSRVGRCLLPLCRSVAAIRRHVDAADARPASPEPASRPRLLLR